jgi:single-stranded-DNA-specific exonuclease
MRKNWIIKEEPKKPLTSKEYPELLLKILAQRGIASSSEAHDFLNPAYEKLFDPFLFKDMRKTVGRIFKALDEKELIVIYSDYDADAITAAAVLHHGLKKLGILSDCYIPDRFTEGYGMNKDAVLKIIQGGAKLIITVDCGINSREEALCAKQHGADLIITDHHELIGELPSAFAVIDPKNPDDKYPFPFLAGVGVAFKLVCALFAEAKERGIDLPKGHEKWLLDLVALGTVADCQELVSENRILVSFGLKVLAKTRNPGLRALLKTAMAENRFDAYTLGFILAPRINAAGRLAHAKTAFHLLTEDNPAEAEKLAGNLNELNLKRQALTEQILSEARGRIEHVKEKKILLAYGNDWPKGVVGLVAGKLNEEYARPVLVINVENGVATGSARSTEHFDLVSALESAKQFLLKFGGHKQAAGFTLKAENIERFYGMLLKHADSAGFEVAEPKLTLDANIQKENIDLSVAVLLEKMGPFGYGNPKPKFAVSGLEVIDSVLVGANGRHAKFRLKFGDKIISAIGFNQPYLAANLTSGKSIDAAVELSINEWNGYQQVEFKIIDAKINETHLVY